MVFYGARQCGKLEFDAEWDTLRVGADALIGPQNNVPYFGSFRRIRNRVLRADEGIGPYIGCVISPPNSNFHVS